MGLHNNYANSKMRIDRHFEDLDAINMTNIKIYYIKMLENILDGMWYIIYRHFNMIRKPRIIENTFIDIKGNKIIGNVLLRYFYNNAEKVVRTPKIEKKIKERNRSN